MTPDKNAFLWLFMLSVFTPLFGSSDLRRPILPDFPAVLVRKSPPRIPAKPPLKPAVKKDVKVVSPVAVKPKPAIKPVKAPPKSHPRRLVPVVLAKPKPVAVPPKKIPSPRIPTPLVAAKPAAKLIKTPPPVAHRRAVPVVTAKPKPAAIPAKKVPSSGVLRKISAPLVAAKPDAKIVKTPLPIAHRRAVPVVPVKLKPVVAIPVKTPTPRPAPAPLLGKPKSIARPAKVTPAIKPMRKESIPPVATPKPLPAKTPVRAPLGKVVIPAPSKAPITAIKTESTLPVAKKTAAPVKKEPSPKIIAPSTPIRTRHAVKTVAPGMALAPTAELKRAQLARAASEQVAHAHQQAEAIRLAQEAQVSADPKAKEFAQIEPPTVIPSLPPSVSSVDRTESIELPPHGASLLKSPTFVVEYTDPSGKKDSFTALNRDMAFEDVMGMSEKEFQSQVNDGVTGVKPDPAAVHKWLHANREMLKKQSNGRSEILFDEHHTFSIATLKELREQAEKILLRKSFITPKDFGSLDFLIHDPKNPHLTDIRWLQEEYAHKYPTEKTFFMVASYFNILEKNMGNYTNDLNSMNSIPIKQSSHELNFFLRNSAPTPSEESQLSTMGNAIHKRYLLPVINLLQKTPLIVDIRNSVPVIVNDIPSVADKDYLRKDNEGFAVAIDKNIVITSGYNPDNATIKSSESDIPTYNTKPAYNKWFDCKKPLYTHHIYTGSNNPNTVHVQSEERIDITTALLAYEAVILAAIAQEADRVVVSIINNGQFGDSLGLAKEMLNRLENIIAASGIKVILLVYNHLDPSFPVKKDYLEELRTNAGIIRGIVKRTLKKRENIEELKDTIRAYLNPKTQTDHEAKASADLPTEVAHLRAEQTDVTPLPAQPRDDAESRTLLPTFEKSPTFTATPRDAMEEREIKKTEQIIFDVNFSLNHRLRVPMIEIVIRDQDNSYLGALGCGYNIEEKTATLWSIGIVPQYRARGYGTLLWNKMIEELKKLDIKKLTLSAVPTGLDKFNPKWEKSLGRLVSWYKKLGGRVIEISKDTDTPIIQVDL